MLRGHGSLSVMPSTYPIRFGTDLKFRPTHSKTLSASDARAASTLPYTPFAFSFILIALNTYSVRFTFTASFLHHLEGQEQRTMMANPFEVAKRGINRLQVQIPHYNVRLKTPSLRRILETNTSSLMHIAVEDTPQSNSTDTFQVDVAVELEEGIVLKVAPHTTPYLLSAFYAISEFLKREEGEVSAHLAGGQHSDGPGGQSVGFVTSARRLQLCAGSGRCSPSASPLCRGAGSRGDALRRRCERRRPGEAHTGGHAGAQCSELRMQAMDA